jgi:large subunit ribosomal protein L2
MFPLIKKKPTTPSLRSTVLLKKNDLFKGKPLKDKTVSFKNKAGRNNQGRITVYTKGGGHKKKYRKLDFLRKNVSGIVESIEYDPFRTANIARIYCEDSKDHVYILAPEGLERGHFVKTFATSAEELSFKVGNVYSLKELPLGLFVHNFSFSPGKKGKIARAAGVSGQIISKNDKYCRIRLNSGEHRFFFLNTEASLGIVSNSSHKLTSLGKAGRSRWLNKRPTVRGVAMNPVDHPHGGGEGKTSGGRPSVTPWGFPTRGRPTRKKKLHHLIIKKKKNV